MKGTLNVLGSCVKFPSIKRVVVTSSVAAVNFNGRPRTPNVIVDETWFSAAEFCERAKVCFHIIVFSVICMNYFVEPWVWNPIVFMSVNNLIIFNLGCYNGLWSSNQFWLIRKLKKILVWQDLITNIFTNYFERAEMFLSYWW